MGKLDEEWVELMVEAKRAGISIEEVKAYLTDSRKHFIYYKKELNR